MERAASPAKMTRSSKTKGGTRTKRGMSKDKARRSGARGLRGVGGVRGVRGARGVGAIEFHPGATYELGVAVVPALFTPEECAQLQKTGSLPGSVEINDRHDELSFRHRVWRVEKSRELWKGLYSRAIGAVHAVDEVYWRQIPRAKTWHAEAEYIEYELKTTRNGKPPKMLPGIGPHVDNASIITLVVMLSSKTSYKGGQSCFEGERAGEPRVLSLDQGDAVFFRGEVCEHWITDVREGRRCILQIECCRMKPGRH